MTQATLFPLGRLLITPGARAALIVADVALALAKHSRGDWGTCDAHDRAANNDAVLSLGRIFSAYVDARGRKFWVITEADRSTTTVLLPDEY